MKRYVILHNIRSAHNVGSIFRTADGAGVTKIFLSGYTPTPLDRFGRKNPELMKTSLGAVDSVPYECVPNILDRIEVLKGEGVEIVAVEQTPRAIEYTAHTLRGDAAFIFGNEVTGVERELLDAADTHISLEMRGVKESLNVSVCAGIILFNAREET